MRLLVEHDRSPAWSRLALSLGLLTAVAGCSSESTRFNDSPFSNPFASRSSPAQDVTGSIPAQRPARTSQIESRPLPPTGNTGNLPPPPRAGAGMSSGAGGMASYQPQSYTPSSDVTGSVAAPASHPAPAYQPQPTTYQPAPQAPQASQPVVTNSGNWNWDGGTAVTVGPNETIEAISHRYGVPAAAIAQANGVAPNAPIYPGQRLVIPRYNYSGTNPVGASAPATRAAAPAAPAPYATASARPAPSPQGSRIHVVGPGETLSKIAKMYGKPVTEIAAANNIPPYKMVRMGDRITIPGVRAASTPVAAAPQATPRPAPAAAPQRMVQAEPSNSARMVTPATDKPEKETPAATEEASNSGPGFRWPVRGRVIAGFGPKPTGQQNDGINLAVPEGTPVKAADDGVVAYAGNELKGYGNLVLVRHSNGFVTAYAHASELMVKRGDTVKRGQVIAKSGQTGNVTSPQLHFEVRKGASPVDPMQFLTGAT